MDIPIPMLSDVSGRISASVYLEDLWKKESNIWARTRRPEIRSGFSRIEFIHPVAHSARKQACLHPLRNPSQTLRDGPISRCRSRPLFLSATAALD
jgi:hypothetical protein